MKKHIKNILNRLLFKFIDLEYLNKMFSFEKMKRNIQYITFEDGVQVRDSANIDNISLEKKNIVLKESAIIDGELRVFNYGGYIEIGEFSYIGPGSRIWSGEKIIIGKNVLISHNVNISDTSAHELNYIERSENFKYLIDKGYSKEKGSIKTAPIYIDDYAWINFGAIILRGVKIGKGAIVSAGSVVTKDVPEFTLVVGNPAVVKKYLK